MTTKETIVRIIRGQGYDFITACEQAEIAIAEFKQGSQDEATYHIGSTSFTLRKPTPQDLPQPSLFARR